MQSRSANSKRANPLQSCSLAAADLPCALPAYRSASASSDFEVEIRSAIAALSTDLKSHLNLSTEARRPAIDLRTSASEGVALSGQAPYFLGVTLFRLQLSKPADSSF